MLLIIRLIIPGILSDFMTAAGVAWGFDYSKFGPFAVECRESNSVMGGQAFRGGEERGVATPGWLLI